MTPNLMQQIEDKLNRGAYLGDVDEEITFLRDEIFQLRLILSTLPLEEIKACAAYANQSRHPGIVVDAKTVSTWIRAQLKPAESDRCDPARGYHSNPHKGCILR